MRPAASSLWTGQAAGPGCATRAVPAAQSQLLLLAIQAGDAYRAGFGIILRLAFVLRLHDSVLEEARAKKKSYLKLPTRVVTEIMRNAGC